MPTNPDLTLLQQELALYKQLAETRKLHLELLEIVIQDTLHREERAKTALLAVLNKIKAPTKDIEKLLNEIEGSEGKIDGDGF